MLAGNGTESLFHHGMTMTTSARRATFPRMIDQFLRQRVAATLPPRELERLRGYFFGLIADGTPPPRRGGKPDWLAIAQECGLALDVIEAAASAIEPGVDAITRFIGPGKPRLEAAPAAGNSPKERGFVSAKRAGVAAEPEKPGQKQKKHTLTFKGTAAPSHRERGVKPKPIIEFPKPLWLEWEEPETFAESLKLHMDRHGDSCWHLRRAVVRPEEIFDHKTFVTWIKGTKAPRSITSFEILNRIERRYRLPEGYFKAKMAHRTRAAIGHRPLDITPSQRRRIAWHLPDDFDQRSPQEREEILEWIQRVIVSGGTDYRRFQALAMRNRYAVRFPRVLDAPAGVAASASIRANLDTAIDLEDDDADERECSPVDAPEHLWIEMAQLLEFKTATLTAFGFQRIGVWGEETAAQKVEHFGLLFGALAASPKSAVRGLGVPLEALTFALLVLPSLWDWYLRWREKRRGFYTAWEVDMLRIGLALTRAETGWLRQNPAITSHLRPIAGLVSEALHPRVQKALQLQQEIARVIRPEGEAHLWMLLHDGAEPAGSPLRNVNEPVVQAVSQLGLNHLKGESRPHSHRWRHTVARLIALCVAAAPQVVMEIFGHRDLEMTLRYMLSDPAIAQDVKRVAAEIEYAVAGEALTDIESGAAGGPAAASLRKGMADFKMRRGENDLGTDSMSEAIRILTFNGRLWELVRLGVLCTKGLGQFGRPCTQGRGSPDPGACRAGCCHRLEMARAKADCAGALSRLLEEHAAALDEGLEMVLANIEGQILAHLMRWDDVRDSVLARSETATAIWSRRKVV